jgi:hypothetical protein
VNFELTGFAKNNGYLTKEIRLASDGSVQCDSSNCVIAAGQAKRVRFDRMSEFAEGIGEMAPNCALSLGVMVDGVADITRVTTRRRLNGVAPRSPLLMVLQGK